MTTADVAPARSFSEVWLISLGHAMTHWYPATFYLLLPLIGRELGLSYSQIGAVLTFQYVAGAVSNLPGGLLVDAVGRKGPLMALSLFWIGFPYLLMGYTHAYWVLLACSALVGIGNNLWHPAAIPLLASRFPRRKGLVVSVHSMGGNVGDAFAPLVAGAMLAAFSWRDVVMMNIVPGVVVSGLILFFLNRGGATKAGAADAARLSVGDMLRACRTLLASRAVVMLSVSSAFRTMTQSTLMTFLPVFLADQMGYSPVWVGGWMFALQAAGFAAAPVAGHLSDSMGRRRIIITSMAMTAVVLLFMALAGRSAAFVFFIAVLGFFLFAIRAVMQAWLLDATPSHMGGTSIGILFGMQAVGAAIGPLIGGVLADRYGLLATFYFLAFTIAVANLFIFFTPITLPGDKPTHDDVARLDLDAVAPGREK
jgi:MFS transporter, FSR family, fosmidomycin resistance protein